MNNTEKLKIERLIKSVFKLQFAKLKTKIEENYRKLKKQTEQEIIKTNKDFILWKKLAIQKKQLEKKLEKQGITPESKLWNNETFTVTLKNDKPIKNKKLVKQYQKMKLGGYTGYGGTYSHPLHDKGLNELLLKIWTNTETEIKNIETMVEQTLKKLI